MVDALSNQQNEISSDLVINNLILMFKSQLSSQQNILALIVQLFRKFPNYQFESHSLFEVADYLLMHCGETDVLRILFAILIKNQQLRQFIEDFRRLYSQRYSEMSMFTHLERCILAESLVQAAEKLTVTVNLNSCLHVDDELKCRLSKFEALVANINDFPAFSIDERVEELIDGFIKYFVGEISAAQQLQMLQLLKQLLESQDIKPFHHENMISVYDAAELVRMIDKIVEKLAGYTQNASIFDRDVLFSVADGIRQYYSIYALLCNKKLLHNFFKGCSGQLQKKEGYLHEYLKEISCPLSNLHVVNQLTKITERLNIILVQDLSQQSLILLKAHFQNLFVNWQIFEVYVSNILVQQPSVLTVVNVVLLFQSCILNGIKVNQLKNVNNFKNEELKRFVNNNERTSGDEYITLLILFVMKNETAFFDFIQLLHKLAQSCKTNIFRYQNVTSYLILQKPNICSMLDSIQFTNSIQDYIILRSRLVIIILLNESYNACDIPIDDIMFASKDQQHKLQSFIELNDQEYLISTNLQKLIQQQYKITYSDSLLKINIHLLQLPVRSDDKFNMLTTFVQQNIELQQQYFEELISRDDQLKVVFEQSQSINQFYSNIIMYDLVALLIDEMIQVSDNPQLLWKYCNQSTSNCFDKVSLNRLKLQFSDESSQAPAITDTDSQVEQNNMIQFNSLQKVMDSSPIENTSYQNQADYIITSLDEQLLAEKTTDSRKNSVFQKDGGKSGAFEPNLVLDFTSSDESEVIEIAQLKASINSPSLIRQQIINYKPDFKIVMSPLNNSFFKENTIPQTLHLYIDLKYFMQDIKPNHCELVLDTQDKIEQQRLEHKSLNSGPIKLNQNIQIKSSIDVMSQLNQNVELLKPRQQGSIYIEIPNKIPIYKPEVQCQACGKEIRQFLSKQQSTSELIQQTNGEETSADIQPSIDCDSVYCPTSNKYFCLSCACGRKLFSFYTNRIVNSHKATYELMCGYQLQQNFSFFDLPAVMFEQCSELLQKRLKISALLRVSLRSSVNLIYGCPKLKFQLLNNSVYLNQYEHVLLDDMFTMQEISSLLVKNVLTSTVHLGFLPQLIQDFRAKSQQLQHYLHQYGLNLALNRMFSDQFIQIQSLTSFAERLYISFRHILLHRESCKVCQSIAEICPKCSHQVPKWSFAQLIKQLQAGTGGKYFICKVCLCFSCRTCLTKGFCKSCHDGLQRFGIHDI